MWVDEAQRDRTADILSSLDGVEQVLPRAEAAAKFLLDPSRMGDLAILADRRTVFGELASESEVLAPGYRSHGSAYEREIPLLRWNVSVPKPHRESPMNWHLLLPFDDDHAR